MINRDDVMEFMRHEEFDDTLYTLSIEDKLECLLTIAESINDEMDHLIVTAIAKWELGK